MTVLDPVETILKAVTMEMMETVVDDHTEALLEAVKKAIHAGLAGALEVAQQLNVPFGKTEVLLVSVAAGESICQISNDPVYLEALWTQRRKNLEELAMTGQVDV